MGWVRVSLAERRVPFCLTLGWERNDNAYTQIAQRLQAPTVEDVFKTSNPLALHLADHSAIPRPAYHQPLQALGGVTHDATG